jgi:hypothetical protein
MKYRENTLLTDTCWRSWHLAQGRGKDALRPVSVPGRLTTLGIAASGGVEVPTERPPLSSVLHQGVQVTRNDEHKKKNPFRVTANGDLQLSSLLPVDVKFHRSCSFRYTDKKTLRRLFDPH